MGPRTWGIGSAQFVIGRGAESDVVLNDPSVSRRHAILQLTSQGTLTIEDAGSRHGTRVNGVRANGVTSLSHADRLAISEHEFVVFERARVGRERAPTAKLRPVSSPTAQTIQAMPRVSTRRADETGEIDTTALLMASVEDALARNDSASASRELKRILDGVSSSERAGGADAALVRRFAACALRTASAIGRGDWIDSVVDLHALRPRVMHAATIDALEGAFERMTTYDRGRFVRYVQDLRARERTLSAYERFCFDRLVKLAQPRSQPPR